MKFSNLLVVYDWQRYAHGDIYVIDGLFSKESKSKIAVDCSGLVAYPSLINANDYLVDNWLPKAAPHKPYKNMREWLQDIQDSAPVLERSKFWKGQDYTDLTKENSFNLAQLGMYKNIFSGVTVLLDHVPHQKEAYYQAFPINIVSKYKQGYSESMKEWWGVQNMDETMEENEAKMPFVMHLTDGIEEENITEFDKVEKLDLLKPNSVFVHCLLLKDEHFKKIADAGTSVVWCPNSNNFLFEKTMDIDSALTNNVNVCIGTDSTLSGSINLLKEILYIKKSFPKISSPQLFKMVTENPAHALKLGNYNGKIEEGKDANLLITKRVSENPYENLCNIETADIQLLLYQGQPIYGKVEFLKYFSWDAKAFYLFNLGADKMFIIGHPNEILTRIEKKLGYKKHFDYLPF
jgi:hypothetical protein